MVFDGKIAKEKISMPQGYSAAVGAVVHFLFGR